MLLEARIFENSANGDDGVILAADRSQSSVPDKKSILPRSTTQISRIPLGFKREI